MKKQTYGQLWDVYVAEAFPKLQQADSRLLYPGQEWGNEKSWQRIFDKLFVPAGVAGWEAAVEIGGGGGKYTERVLRAGDKVRLFGFDVSRNFLDATAARLQDFVGAGRLSLHEIDPVQPDAILTAVAAQGLARKVDAVFSIDAMVHVDLTYLTTYWMNAALLLKPGGRVLMTLADPTTVSGFQKILRDIRKFYRFQGRICPKFEYLSAEIASFVLRRLGFEIELLEPWSNHEGRPPRDLYLIARLDRPEQAEAFRDALRADPSAVPASLARPESYTDLWTREAPRAIAGGPDRPPAAAVLNRLFGLAESARWRQAIEIGTGDGRYAEALLRANPAVKLTVFDVSDRVMKAAAAKLSDHVASGRLGFLPVDPLHPDGMLAAFGRDQLTREVDAVFSIDAMVQVDLQYQIAYWLNAALLLRPGGWLIFSVADATTEAGFAKLVGDIRRYFPWQGQACTRFEYQSFTLVRPLLERLGFDIAYAGHWDPHAGAQDGSESGRDLYVVAQLARPEAAEALRAHISIGLPMPMSTGATGEAPEEAAPEPVAEDAELSRIVGQVLFRRLQEQANPGVSRDKLREAMRDQWPGNRREYTRLGSLVLRDLAEAGLSLRQSGPPRAGRTSGAE
jgi:SAM-dependent methyltransferase